MIFDLFVDDDCFAVYFLMTDPETIDLRAVSGRDKGFDLIVADESHDAGELILRQQGLDLRMFLAAITALNLIQGAPANEFLHDILAYPFGFFRDDADTLALIKRGCEIIDSEAVDPRTDDTDDYHTEIIDEESRAADDHTADGNRRTDIEMEVFIDDLTEDVQATGRSVDAEHNRLTNR